MKVTLFNNSGPNADITVIASKRCTEASLKMCNVPDHARSYRKNSTAANLISNEPIFVRGVNSSFYEVEIGGESYYVHEQYVRREA